MERAAKDRNKRNSERLLALSALGQHPWQQPDFIERNRKRQLALFAAGEHPFQRPDVIESNRERNSVRQLALSNIGEHNFQRPDVIKRNSVRQLALSDIGEHPFQRPDVIESYREHQLALTDIGEHNFQCPEVMEKISKSNSKRELENWSNGTYNFQQGIHWRHAKALKTGEKGEWTDEEESKLTMLVGKHGLRYGTWIEINKEMSGECS
jgi:hypothetical protein